MKMVKKGTRIKRNKIGKKVEQKRRKIQFFFLNSTKKKKKIR